MLDLFASNCNKRSFLLINSTLHVIAYPLNSLSVFTTLNSSYKGRSKSKSMFFQSFILGSAMYVL